MKRSTLLATMIVLALVTLSCGLLGGDGKDVAEATQPPPADSAGEAPDPPPEATTPPEPPAPPESEGPRIRPADGMTVVHVPDGEFLMGWDASPYSFERPEHTVYLDAYWIDQTEVTNAQYRACVEAETCAAPNSWNDASTSGDDQPAFVSWDDAQAYCEWVGARLPTEAEWEKAARGTDGRLYPWGGEEFDPSRANIQGPEDGYESTAPVGSFPTGASPYGVLDMSGNAAEWAADWFQVEYYAQSPAQNPTGPPSGDYDQRVIRGGSWHSGRDTARCIWRKGTPLGSSEFGFRCVSNTPPDEDAEPSSSAEITSASTPEPSSAGAQAGEWPLLESYRETSIMRDGGADGLVQSELTAEWNAATSASRYVVGSGGQVMLEQVTIANEQWTRMGDMPWQQTTVTPEEQTAWESKMSLAQLWGDADAVQEELDAALPEGIALVPAQIFPVPIKAAMVFDGEETVNGVHCKRYAVDTDLDYTHDKLGGGEMHTTGHATGQIWIADQSGIPPIIVRAWMDEALVIDGEASHPYWEHNITDVNVPITIERPE